MDKSYLQAGEIVTTHGVRGEVKILPWADSPEFLLEFDCFYIDGVPYKVEQARVHKGCVLAKLQGIDDPACAQALRGNPSGLTGTRPVWRTAASLLPTSSACGSWQKAPSLEPCRRC